MPISPNGPVTNLLRAVHATQVLYLNSVLNFPQYRLAKEMEANPDWWLRDSDGKLVTLYGDFGPANMTVFDFAQPAVRAAFVAACVDAVKTGYVDGCFVDRAIDGSPTDLGGAKQKAYDDGHAQVLQEMQRQISAISAGPLIANHAYNCPSRRRLSGLSVLHRTYKYFFCGVFDVRAER